MKAERIIVNVANVIVWLYAGLALTMIGLVIYFAIVS